MISTESAATPGERWATAVVDVADPLPALATGGAARVHVTVCRAGVPVGTVVVPAPADPLSAADLAAAVIAQCAGALAAAPARERPSAGSSDGVPLSVTVAICSADRPDDLARALASTAQLRGVDEVLVVDNGRAQTDATRAVTAAAGARYVREPVPGLDRARNRALAAATGDVVCFTDDDVEVDAGWAAALVARFDDPLVMAVTGLVLPARMDTPARRLSERLASHGRGFRPLVLDGTTRLPTRAGRAGAGAAMAFRAPFLRAIGGFPPELDCGTPSASGGDTYALMQVLNHGYRVAYEPRALAFHWHRDDEAALHRALAGYGTGTVAYLARGLTDPDRPLAPAAAVVATGSYGRVLVRRALRSISGRSATPPSFALDELRGLAQGPARYLAARRESRGLGPGPVLPEEPLPAPWIDELRAAARARPPEAELPGVSIVIPTRGRREHVVRLLAEIEAQDYPDELVETIVVVDGDVDGTATAIRTGRWRRPVTVVVLDAPAGPGDGNGAAAARNAGADRAERELLVFLDDDLVPLGPELLRAHAAVHDGGPVLGVGPCPVDLRDAHDLFAQRLRNWWVQATVDLLRVRELGATDLLSGNLSVRREDFERLGGFAAVPRREDWELGARALAAGFAIRCAPGAGALQTVVDLSIATALADRRREGAGDVLIARRFPAYASGLPLGAWHRHTPRTEALVRAVLRRPALADRIARAARPALRACERAGARAQHAALLDRCSLASYWAGVAQAAGGEPGWDRLAAALPLEDPAPEARAPGEDLVAQMVRRYASSSGTGAHAMAVTR